MPTNTWLCFRYARYIDRGGCGRAPDSYHTGTRCSRVIARRAAARSAASSSSVEEMNTRTRWSGVKITSDSAITSQASPQPHHHEDHYVKLKFAKLSWTSATGPPSHQLIFPTRSSAA